MENRMIGLDTSVLIEYYRKTDKSRSFLYELSQTYSNFAASVVTEFEIYIGSDTLQQSFWDTLFQTITVIPFDSLINKEAVTIQKKLKQRGMQIDIPDLFIAATAKNQLLPLATLNKKHFERIDGLELILRE